MKIKGKAITGILIFIILAIGLYYFHTSKPGELPIPINENIGFNKSTKALFNEVNG